MDSGPASVFDRDTAVERASEGVFAATITDRWNRLLGGPLGGYLIATCLRALGEIVSLPDPLVVSAFFLRPGQLGPAEIHAEQVRAGRRTATGQATLIQDGSERVRLVATFADLAQAQGRTTVSNQPPDLPSPKDCLDPLKDIPTGTATVAERVEVRMPELPGWLQGKPTGQASGQLWMRLADGREPDLLSLALLVDALPLAVLELGEPGSTTLELTIHLRAQPAPGWLACRNSTRHLIGGVHEEDGEIWDSRGQLVAQSRQLALLPGRA
jgi:acyl-CoA thioesterase